MHLVTNFFQANINFLVIVYDYPHLACMDRVVRTHLQVSVRKQLDSLRFAYKSHRGIENTTLTIVDKYAQQITCFCSFH